MSNILIIFQILIASSIAGAAVYLTSRSSFGVRPNNPGPFWLHVYLEVPVLILPATVLTSFDSVRELWIFVGVAEDDYYIGSLAIYYGLIMYFISVYFFDKVLSSNSIVTGPRFKDFVNPRLLVSIVLILQLISIFGIMIFVDRLPILSLFASEEVGVFRKAATIDFRGPPILLTLIKMYGYFGIFLLALINTSRVSVILKFLLLMLSSICVVWTGEKGPLIVALMGYWFVMEYDARRKIRVLRLILVGLAIGTLAAAATAIVGVEGEFTVMEFYFIRTFLGQISGLFQTIGLVDPDPKYFLGWIPFAGSINDNLPVFARDLMIITEGDTATSGTKNTFFLAEAYGAGGWIMLLLAPVIVAVSLVASLHLLRSLSFKYVDAKFSICAIFLFMINSWLTSGMAGFPAFRGFFFTLFVLITIAAPYKFLLGDVGRGARV